MRWLAMHHPIVTDRDLHYSCMGQQIMYFVLQYPFFINCHIMLKHPLRLFIFIGSCLLFLQCQKDPPIGLVGRVFVAGVEMGNFYTDSSYSIAKLWVDGQPYDLPSATHMAQAEDVFVSKNVVYVAGSEFGYNGVSRAVLWRNMRPTYLSSPDVEGSAFGVYVDGKDVYVTGLLCKNFVCKTVVWKNGVETLLADSLSYPWEIVLADGKQYVTVNKKTDAYLRPALMQGKDMVMLEVPERTEFGEAISVYVKDKNVYAVGSIWDYNNIAAMWVNGKLTILARGNGPTIANDITLSVTNDIYVTGALNQQCVVWKNGKPVSLQTGEFSIGNSIAVSGKNVYVAGSGDLSLPNKHNVPLLWLNNAVQELPTKTNLGVAYAVFVK